MQKSGQRLLRLGTRGSLLAVAQSKLIAAALESQHDDLHVELITIRTTGDRITDRPLADAGGKGLFTKELEQALLAGMIDFAVHSYKDVPVTMPLVDQRDLLIAAVPKRADPRDVLVGRWPSLRDLPPGARVGTGSLRRQCQLLAQRSDLVIQPIRGNIDTRLRKLANGEHDAIILAAAGLQRANLFDSKTMTLIDVDEMIPSPGQGALAMECRADDRDTIETLRALNDADSALCVDLEREVVRLLNGDCHSPIAALATIAGDSARLRIAVGQTGGHLPVLRSHVAANIVSGKRDRCRSLPAIGVQSLT